MATIAVLSVGITGMLNSSLEMRRRLAARGHRVLIASTNGRARQRVESAGIPFVHLEADVPAALREQARRARSGGARRFLAGRGARARVAQVRGRAALRGLGLDELLDAHAPQLFLVESEMHSQILYLRRLGVPLALLEYHLAVRRVPGIAPLSSTLMPGGALAPVRAALAWRRLLLKRAARRLLWRWYLEGWDDYSVWSRLAAAAGRRLDDLAHRDQWPLLTHVDLPVLHLCGAELDFPASAADGRDFVGPVIQQERSDAGDDGDARACAELAARLAGSGRPLVACATGSILTLPSFVRKVAAAAEGAAFDVIMATGRRSDPAAFGAVPSNVHLFRYIPQLDVLRHAALFIGHGGIASIHEALLAGVPLLVYSAGAMDENGNAARVAYHGVGQRGRRGDGAADLRRRVEALLADDGVRARVRAMQEALQRYVHDGVFEARVDALLTAARAAPA